MKHQKNDIVLYLDNSKKIKTKFNYIFPIICCYKFKNNKLTSELKFKTKTIIILRFLK